MRSKNMSAFFTLLTSLLFSEYIIGDYSRFSPHTHGEILLENPDKLGGMNGATCSLQPASQCFNEGWVNHCLVQSLHHLGVPVSLSRDGPLWALADGNQMLEPFGLRLMKNPTAMITSDSKYVVHEEKHFFAVQVLATCAIKMNGSAITALTMSDIDAITQCDGVSVFQLVSESDTKLCRHPHCEPPWVRQHDRCGGMEDSVGRDVGGSVGQGGVASRPTRKRQKTSVGEGDSGQGRIPDPQGTQTAQDALVAAARSKCVSNRRKDEDHDIKAMIADLSAKGQTSAATLKESRADNPYSILKSKQRFLVLITQHVPHWPPSYKHLTLGALALYTKRIIDIGLCEHVLLLHIMEGDNYIRSHDGTFYFYDDGAFRIYSGVISESVLGRCKAYLLALQGLFRKLADKQPVPTADSDEELLTRLNRIWLDQTSQGETSQQVIVNLTKHALHAPKPDEENRWNHLCYNVCKLSPAIEQELMGRKLITYYIEWCSTPRRHKPGLAFRDSCVVMAQNGFPVSVEKSSSNDIYVYVDHALMDPVQQQNVDRVSEFLQQTFLQNRMALPCQLSALVLALNQENIDRCFWTVGPGGAGQSLFTWHLHAVLPSLHALLDTNIYYSDDELRKQAESLIGKLVATGQESVEGSAQGMREDLYKKLGSHMAS